MKKFISKNIEKLLVVDVLLVVVMIGALVLSGATKSAYAAPTMYTPSLNYVKAIDYNKMKLSYTTKGTLTGVQIYNATTKKYIKTTNKEKYTIKDLAYNQEYKFKVRAYYTKGGKTFYSLWSGAQRAKQKMPALTITESRAMTDNRIRTDYYTSYAYDNDDTVAQFYNVNTKKFSTFKFNTWTTIKIWRDLKYGKTYTLKARLYKKVDGKKYYSDWNTQTKYFGTKTPTIKSITSCDRYANIKVKAPSNSALTGFQLYNFTTEKYSKHYHPYPSKSEIIQRGKYTTGKTYKFKVRSYYKTTSGTKYSSWSATKSIKISNKTCYYGWGADF